MSAKRNVTRRSLLFPLSRRLAVVNAPAGGKRSVSAAYDITKGNGVHAVESRTCRDTWAAAAAAAAVRGQRKFYTFNNRTPEEACGGGRGDTTAVV